MDRETIYLDNDEEITSVVDKLKKTDFSAIDLVIPKEALILQSVVNLKLLKRQAESLGKEITLVTQDKVGKKLAEQIGIPVVGKPGETPKEVHMSEADKEMVAVAAGAAAASAVEATAHKVEAEEEDLGEEIEFKKESDDGLLEETSEVVGNEESKEGAEKSSEIVSPKPISKDLKKKRLKRALIGIGFLSLALFIAGYIYLPMIRIKIQLAAEKKEVDFTFTADKSYTSVDTGAQVIPAQEITAELEESYKYAATGKKDVGTKANGTVTVSNRSGSAKTINSGAKIVSSGGLVFVITGSNVNVDGATVDGGGNVIPGTVSGVPVTANANGDQYNIGATNFTFADTTTYPLQSASSSAAFTGGTTKQINIVTQTDINTAKEDAQKQIEQALLQKAIETSDRNQRIVDKAYKIEVISANPSPAVGGEATEFELKVKAKITALAFTEDDLTKLAETVLADEIGSSKEIVEKSSLTAAAEFVEGDFTKGTVKIRVSGEAYIATKIDDNAVKIEIAHEKNDVALDYLKSIDGVKDAIIEKQFPSFYKRIPRINANITITKEIDKGE